LRRFIDAALLPNLVGLITAQCLATLIVFLSNQRLFEKISAIHNAGYLGIPNRLTAPLLISIDSAFYGGVLFTLSLGAGLSLLSFGAAWLWVYAFKRQRIVLPFYCLLLSFILFMVNHRGFVFFESLYFVIIPLLVFWMTAKRNPQKKVATRLWMLLFPVYPLILLTLLWSTQLDSRLFISIRDNILMSNPVGLKINDFYYRYTLYPAETFKSLSQKLLRSCDLSGLSRTPGNRRVVNQLSNYDYLPVDGVEVFDLTLKEENNQLVFMHAGRKIVETAGPAFLSEPRQLLDRFSVETDRLSFFRSFTFYSILIAFPVLLYFMFYSIFRLILSVFFHGRDASITASCLCFILGIGLLIPVYFTSTIQVDSGNLQQMIASDNWQDQAAAMRYLEKNRIDLDNPQVYASIVNSPYLPLRYWAARALAVSRQPETYNYLMTLAHDPHVNVVCQALYGLGKRGRRQAVADILSIIKTSHSWYVQRYGYNALRMLGWRQPVLK
jgi:hypothetical protein